MHENHTKLRRMIPPLLALVMWTIIAEFNQTNGAEPEELVAALVSRNKLPPRAKPKILRYEFPEDFDQRDIQRVLAARDELLGKGIAAFPSLIDALDDSRYSYTEGVPHAARHLTVHDVCFHIIEVQLEICPFRRPTSIEHGPPGWLPEEAYRNTGGAKEAMQKWWAPRKHLNRRELQLEFVQWAVSFEKKQGFMDRKEEAVVLGWYRPLLSRLKDGRPIQVAYDGEFLDEGELLPMGSEVDRWYERWFPLWEERWEAEEKNPKTEVDPNN